MQKHTPGSSQAKRGKRTASGILTETTISTATNNELPDDETLRLDSPEREQLRRSKRPKSHRTSDAQPSFVSTEEESVAQVTFRLASKKPPPDSQRSVALKKPPPDSEGSNFSTEGGIAQQPTSESSAIDRANFHAQGALYSQRSVASKKPLPNSQRSIFSTEGGVALQPPTSDSIANVLERVDRMVEDHPYLAIYQQESRSRTEARKQYAAKVAEGHKALMAQLDEREKREASKKPLPNSQRSIFATEGGVALQPPTSDSNANVLERVERMVDDHPYLASYQQESKSRTEARKQYAAKVAEDYEILMAQLDERDKREGLERLEREKTNQTKS